MSFSSIKKFAGKAKPYVLLCGATFFAGLLVAMFFLYPMYVQNYLLNTYGVGSVGELNGILNPQANVGLAFSLQENVLLASNGILVAAMGLLGARSLRSSGASRKLVILLVVVAVCLGGLGGNQVSFAQAESATIIIDPSGLLPRDWSYLIYQVGSTNYAVNGTYCTVDYNGIVASTVIQAAISALPSTESSVNIAGGLIYLKAGIYELYESLLINKYHVTIKGEGWHSTELRVTGSFPAITCSKSFFTIENLRIGMLAAINPYNSYALYLNPTTETITYCTVQDVMFRRSYFTKGTETGCAIYLHTNTTDKSLYFNSFSHIYIDGSWQYAIKMTAETAGTSINGNYFSDIMTYHCYCDLFIDPQSGTVNSNSFVDFALSDYYATSPLIVNGTANQLRGVKSWDMPSGTILTIQSGAIDTLIEGGAIARISNSGTRTRIKDVYGFVTENSGTQTIANGETVSHGLAGTPTTVVVTARVAVYGTPAVAIVVAVSARGTSTFTVSAYWVNGTAISADAIVIDYYAEYKP